jgi:pterin-4a-carbinolamine dehydratase
MKFNEITEGKYRENDLEEFVPNDEQLDQIKNKYLPDWEMLDHRELTTMYVCQDHQEAIDMVVFINELSEDMDHFAEVTQDVTEVKVKTATFDVKGLTILDFQLAIAIDTYAEEKGIEQTSTSGNFGMHEDQGLTEAQFDEAAGEKDACYHKVKSRYKVWPSAYASGALVKCRKVGAKNWGNSKKK